MTACYIMFRGSGVGATFGRDSPYRHIIAALSTMAIGLAKSWPAMSGAEPCTWNANILWMNILSSAFSASGSMRELFSMIFHNMHYIMSTSDLKMSSRDFEIFEAMQSWRCFSSKIWCICCSAWFSWIRLVMLKCKLFEPCWRWLGMWQSGEQQQQKCGIQTFFILKTWDTFNFYLSALPYRFKDARPIVTDACRW